MRIASTSWSLEKAPKWRHRFDPECLTLELSDVANLPIALYRGMKIGQISFYQMSSAVERPYGSRELGSKYQGQSTPTASQFYKDFEGTRPKPKGGRKR